jgi:hypothetical protein
MMSNSNLWRFLLMSLFVMSSLLAQTQSSPPLIRLDLLILKIEVGGSSPGIGLQPPRIGADVAGVVGVSVGIGLSTTQPASAIADFVQAESALAQVLLLIQSLIQNGGSAEQLQAAYQEAQRLSALKAILGLMITP